MPPQPAPSFEQPEDGSIEQLEETVPEAARIAIERAFCRAMASGKTVLVAEQDTLQAVSAEGSSTVVKHIEPSISMVKNSIIVIPE
jgi:hypothetical protein